MVFQFIKGVVSTSAVADIAANRSKFDNFIYTRCSQYSPDLVTYDDAKQHLDQFTDYFTLTISQLPHEKNNFCDVQKPTLIELMKSFLKDTRPCLSKEEKYLPKFIYYSFGYFMTFLCADDGKNINNFFSTVSFECLGKLNQQGGDDEISHCFEKITALLDLVITKEKLCGDLDAVKNCSSTVIMKHCPEVLPFQALNTRLFGAIRKPCNSASWVLGISNLVLLASVLAHKMMVLF